MKSFTAIYDTKTISNIEYVFDAKNMEEAKIFCEGKFNVPVKKIVIN